MAIQFVTSTQVMSVNAITNFNPQLGIIPTTASIPCKSVPEGFYWLVPKKAGPFLKGYTQLNATDAVKPTPDSTKILRLKDAVNANTIYEIAVLDSDGITGNTWVDNCNGCCGATPVMPEVEIPAPILQSPPDIVEDNGSTRIFKFPFPSNPNGLGYSILFPWFNGVAPTTPFDTTGITNIGGFITWANANWGDYGTWTASGNVAVLENTDSDSVILAFAGVDVSLVPALWCFTLSPLSPPATLNGVKFGSSGSIFTFAPFVAGTTSQQQIINAIKPFIPDAIFTISSGKLQVSTTQAQPILLNGTTAVVTAASGACS